MRSGDWAVHISAAVRDEWCRACRFPVERTRVIYNGVEPAGKTDRAAVREQLIIGESEFVFCVPGRLDSNKGHAYLISALGGMRNTGNDWRLLVCGDGKLRAELERAVNEAGVTDRVRFLGWRSDLPSILGACDCTVLPSTSSENLSVAVLESLMAGTPAIVTKVGGMAEAVKDGVTGYVVPPRDSKSLTTAMRRMLDQRPLAKAMGVAARQDAESRFTRKRMLIEYAAQFAELLGSNGGGACGRMPSRPFGSQNRPGRRCRI
jgi:glycosyltransferase involved in cell wall biosynthesis